MTGLVAGWFADDLYLMMARIALARRYLTCSLAAELRWLGTHNQEPEHQGLFAKGEWPHPYMDKCLVLWQY